MVIPAVNVASHHAVDTANIIIIVNLDLRAAEPGIYELIAVPLKISRRRRLADPGLSAAAVGRVILNAPLTIFERSEAADNE